MVIILDDLLIVENLKVKYIQYIQYIILED